MMDSGGNANQTGLVWTEKVLTDLCERTVSGDDEQHADHPVDVIIRVASLQPDWNAVLLLVEDLLLLVVSVLGRVVERIVWHSGGW